VEEKIGHAGSVEGVGWKETRTLGIETRYRNLAPRAKTPGHVIERAIESLYNIGERVYSEI